MISVLIDDISSSDIYGGNLIRCVEFTEDNINRLIRYLDDSDSANLVFLLNKINNQGITKVESKRFSYYKGELELGFSCLSTAERVFLLAYAANKMKFITYFSYDIYQLTERTLKLFISEFRHSPYVNIAYLYPESVYYFNHLLKSAD